MLAVVDGEHAAVLSATDRFNVDEWVGTTAGFQLMRRFIALASTDGDAFRYTGPSDTPLKPFEFDILRRLHAAGLDSTPQHGGGQLPSRLRRQARRRTRRFVLAVEADGAPCHSGVIAREPRGPGLPHGRVVAATCRGQPCQPHARQRQVRLRHPRAQGRQGTHQGLAPHMLRTLLRLRRVGRRDLAARPRRAPARTGSRSSLVRRWLSRPPAGRLLRRCPRRTLPDEGPWRPRSRARRPGTLDRPNPPATAPSTVCSSRIAWAALPRTGERRKARRASLMTTSAGSSSGSGPKHSPCFSHRIRTTDAPRTTSKCVITVTTGCETAGQSVDRHLRRGRSGGTTTSDRDRASDLR